MGGKQKLYLYKGEMLTLQEVAEKTGMTVGQLIYRTKEYGCGIEEAVQMLMKRGKRLEWNGRLMKYSEIAAETGISAETIRRRVESGVPLEIAATRKVMSAQDRAMYMHRENFEIIQYVNEGSWRDQCAKKICRDVGWNDPRKLDFKMTSAETYEFHTETIRFLIELIGNNATCTGWLKSNGAVLICRKYRVSKDECKEVTYA